MSTQKTITAVTLHGMPVQVELDWPFRPSAGGSDWHVVHGTVRLADGGPLHADVALDLSQTIREALPSLDGDLAYWVAVNTARKAVDDKQLELLKASKRQPVPVSSRCYSMRSRQFRFWEASAQQIEDFVARKVFWLSGGGTEPVLVADPCDAQYLGASDPDMLNKLRAAAEKLANQKLIVLDGDHARATDALLAKSDSFIAVKDEALAALHAKHAFERA